MRISDWSSDVCSSDLKGPADQQAAGIMQDPFGRSISYLRVSVTDRCDFRCVYFMSEDMSFLPKTEVLSLEELDRLCEIGRASCRERVCQYGSIQVVAVSLKKKKETINIRKLKN